MAVKANYITQVRQAVSSLMDDVSVLRDLDLTWNAEGYSTGIVAGDFTGANADLTVAQFTSIIVSVEAILSLLSATSNAHYTNLLKARP